MKKCEFKVWKLEDFGGRYASKISKERCVVIAAEKEII